MGSLKGDNQDLSSESKDLSGEKRFRREDQAGKRSEHVEIFWATKIVEICGYLRNQLIITNEHMSGDLQPAEWLILLCVPMTYDSYESYESYDFMTVLVCSQSREAYVSRAATVFNELKKPYAPSAEDSVGSGWRGKTRGFPLSEARVPNLSPILRIETSVLDV